MDSSVRPPEVGGVGTVEATALLVPARCYRHLRKQHGAIAIMLALSLIMMIAICGMSIDLSRLYNRKAELQGLAEAAALAAAKKLDGTAAGVTRAVNAAANVASDFKYEYHQKPVEWSDSALTFSTNSQTGWVNGGAAAASPSGVFFVKVDASELDAALGTVNNFFIQFLSSSFASSSVSSQVVAGRSSIKVTPLGICAMSNNAGEARANPGPPANIELVQYGFRRGVAYDLMQLNPKGATPANFVINPIDPPGTDGSSANTSVSVVGPFVCAGKMSMARVTGGSVTISSPFPIGSLYKQLNSRFDQYPDGLCNPNGAPPDANVKQYVYSSIPWMSTTPGSPGAQTAQSVVTTIGDETRRETKADPFPAPVTNTAPMYGPLWAFAKAVPFSEYSSGTPEPTNGYTPFGISDWATLYNPGKPVAVSYPSTPPYHAINGTHFLAPSISNRPGLRFRRVLNVPLLSCPITAGATTATVLAIGKFFMTVPATDSSISAEFAGLAAEQSLGTKVELYP
jgi:Flp pilus assembly protein TadG